jgi:hypothetical protein
MRLATVLTIGLCAIGAQAAGVIVYPSKGQSPQQQLKDQAECSTWATSATGFDPRTSPPQPAKAPPPKQGGILRGALAGAAVGELTGGDAGTGAAIGGLVGGMRQASRNEQAKQQANAQYQQQLAAYQQAQGNHGRAYAACLEGRGYTVK